MLLSRRYRAPAGDGDMLADPPLDQVSAMLERARRFELPGQPFAGLPFADWQALARREALDLARAYHRSLNEPIPAIASDIWLVAGHQPDLFHPGVWLKNFALAGLARAHGAVALNLIVDNDAAKTAAVRVPRWRPGLPPAAVTVVPIAFDEPPNGVPYEEWTIRDEGLFRSFPERLAELTHEWPFQPIAPRYWDLARNGNGRAVRFAAARRALERAWGTHNLELPVSWLGRAQAFALFAQSILDELPRFHAAYNTAVADYRRANRVRSRNHPVPDLARAGDQLEAPFWVWRPGERRRRRLFGRPAPGDQLRPRALTLTLFARLALADMFLHGIGGGKYDELTDAIAADFFGAAPPPYLVLSGTLRLPLPAYPVEAAPWEAARRRAREVEWNPQRFLQESPLAAEPARLIAERPATRRARRQRYSALRHNLDELRPLITAQAAAARAECDRLEAAARANAILRSREYPFILYPEEQLRTWFEKITNIEPQRHGGHRENH